MLKSESDHYIRMDFSEEVTCKAIIETIMSNDRRPNKQPPIPSLSISSPDSKPEKLPEDKVLFLLNKVRPILLSEPTLIEIEPPIVICGDTHGQFCDLLDIFDTIGWPPTKRYLFMGKPL